jgi:hypothetical protein
VPEHSDHLFPCRFEHPRRVRSAPFAVGAPFLHIGELEPDNAQAVPGQSFRHGAHERRVHAGTGAVSQGDRSDAIVRAVG